ncbi:hypothetical protein ACFYY8_31845 [Streptosporangium sp. NPDC001559]|uniref:hypothetical protein n=1 Tax=Streptosporangium sp. NPDC001559 TaxID=3366187 RepID=UPI0036E5CCF9
MPSDYAEPKEPNAPQVVDKYQLANLLSLKVSWIEERCRRRLIPHLLIAGQYRFTQAHITEIISMHERRPVAEPAAAQQRHAQQSPPGLVAPLRNRGLPTHRLRRPNGAS